VYFHGSGVYVRFEGIEGVREWRKFKWHDFQLFKLVNYWFLRSKIRNIALPNQAISFQKKIF